MKKFRVKVLMSENGKEEEKIFCLEVRGKDLPKEIIEKRLNNNLKSLQSIWKNNVNPTIKLKMISYEEI